MSGPPELRRIVTTERAGERLDLFVAAEMRLPRSRIQRWIRAGLVEVDGESSKPARALAAGETVVCTPPLPQADERVRPEPGELSLLHQDADVVVLDKPAGLPMHPGAGRRSGTLAHRLVARYPEMSGVGGPGRPGIVHRLDIDTTGVVVAARTAAAYAALSEDFAARRVEKLYLAICYGAPRPTEGSFTGAIGRHPERRKEMTVRSDGRPARTDYSTLATISGVSLLRLELMTGRTHQIRVHLKAAGHPLVGDPVYGEARWKALRRPVRPVLRDFPRPALHAWTLDFDHPASGQRLHFSSPPAADLTRLWRELGGAKLPR